MTTTPTATEAPSLFFTDARACKAWLNALPVTNAVQAQSTLLDALRVFNRAEFDALERLKCLELLRERNAFMLAEQRQRHFTKSLPLSPADSAAWSAALNVLEEIEAGYRKCQSEASLDAHAALVAQRILRYIGAQMLHHATIYRPFDSALWTRLHQQYAAAEKAGHAAERVKDSLESESGSSVMEAYARAVLLQAAGLAQLMPPQIAFAEAVLRQFMRKVQVLDRPAAESPSSVLPVVVDLSQARGPEPALREALSASQRVIDIEGLSRSVRRRLRALQSGDDVASLGLPPEVSAVDPQHTLQHLARHWGESGARSAATPAAAPSSPTAGLVYGLGDIHFFLSGGKAFEAPGKERELSRQEKEDIAVFGRVTERTQSIMAAAGRTGGMAASPHTFTVEPWDVIEESVESVKLKRGAKATKTVAVGRLVALRLGDRAPFVTGIVREIVNAPDSLTMTVAAFPGKPEPTAVRATTSQWAPGLVLPPVEKLGVPRTLLVPAGVAFRGRPIFAWEGEAKQAKVHEILDHGADFDRVTLI